ncbi:MAG: ribosome biogenesis GTPase Der [Bacteroidetes bacterium]|jgi:GTP-binding protein|nr:ribosome biogenesis GTPase Der [Bacteroidota bacterium]MDA0930462.1 ribosome biogenesis GTPase Der [Bacteroidota bacterium]
MGKIVAIVGRPNVGKSTLFNRLTESRQAIVDEFSGVTRDRHYGKADWQGKTFSIIDTGGYVRGSDDVFEAEIRKQVDLAIDEADVLLFVVDSTTGITDLDEQVADMLRRSKKEVLVVANKVDNFERLADIHTFYALGLGEVHGLSSISGSGTGELLDALMDKFGDFTEAEELDLPRIAIVGRPNVGKSSITNLFLGEERNIVTPVAGTTRDSIDVRYNAFGFDFYLVDTAGLRKKAKVQEDLEFYSSLRSVRSIERADVCLLMLDATQGIESQDINIFHLIQKNHKGVVVLVNKWDLIEKDHKSADRFKEAILHKIAPFRDVPIIFTSVPEKQRVFQALEAAVQVYENRSRKIKTRELNDYILPIIEAFPPPAYKGKYIRIKYVTQLPIAYPAFAFFCNLPQYLREPYKRFLENKLREKFTFTGTPMEIFFRQK